MQDVHMLLYSGRFRAWFRGILHATTIILVVASTNWRILKHGRNHWHVHSVRKSSESRDLHDSSVNKLSIWQTIWIDSMAQGGKEVMVLRWRGMLDDRDAFVSLLSTVRPRRFNVQGRWH
jgi:hypothetical protein